MRSSAQSVFSGTSESITSGDSRTTAMATHSDIETSSQFAVGESGTHSPKLLEDDNHDLDVLTLGKRLEEVESKVNASLDAHAGIADVVSQILEEVKNLGNTMITRDDLDKALKPIHKNLEDVKAILSTMKATPIMSSAPKQTTEKGKGKQEDKGSPSAKPTPEKLTTDKPTKVAGSIAEKLAEQNRRNKKMG